MSDGLNMLPRIGEPETSPSPSRNGRETPYGSSQKLAGGRLAALAANIPDTSGPPPTPNVQAPGRWIYDFDPASGAARATFNGLVTFTEGGSEGAGVTSWNGQTGAVVMTADDIAEAGGLSNPDAALLGAPTAPTPAPGDSSTAIATSAFVAQAIANAPKVASFNGRAGAVTLTAGDITGAGGAPSVSPALTGTPTAPTAAQGDTSSQIATDAFVANAIASGSVTSFNGRHGTVSLALSDVQSVGGAPIASPNFTGTPSGPTAAPGTATTALASTAFVMNAITSGTAGVASVNTRTGAVVLNASDLTAMGGAPLNAPTFTGASHAPTPSAGDNSTLIATTAYVETALGSLPAGVATFNGRTGTVTLALADVTSVGGAPLASPTFTGSPLTTTAPPGDNSTRIADTAFVTAGIASAVAALPPVPIASTTTPLMDGTAAVGTGTTWARSDHVHPTDTSRAAVSALANYLPLTGGTLSGPLSAGTITSSVGIINIQGGATPVLNLVTTAGATVGQFSSNGATLSISNAAPVGGSMSIAGNINLNPAGAANLLLNVGAGFQSGGGPWSSLSDARIKNIHGEFEAGLDELKELRPVVYSYRGNDEIDSGDEAAPISHNRAAAEAETRFVGLIAQEVEAVFPDMVTTRSGTIDGEPVDDLRVLNTTPLTFALINAVKTLSARIEALEERLAAA